MTSIENASMEKIEKYVDEVHLREEPLYNSKTKKKEERIFGMTNFFRGNGYKYKGKRKK